MSKRHRLEPSFIDIVNMIGVTGLVQCKCSICKKLLVGAFRAGENDIVPRCGEHYLSEPSSVPGKVIVPMASDMETN
jgi:hypothetical protein